MTHEITRLVFSFVPCPETSMIASTRIARFLRDRLRAPLVWDESVAGYRPDVLVIVNGAFAFCKVLPQLAEAIAAARRIVWVQNDYTIVPPICDGQATSPFRAAFVERRRRGKSHLDFWTSCEKLCAATPGSSLVNWNALTLDDAGDDEIRVRRARNNGRLLYYGSFRTGRAQYFEKYFRSSRVPLTVSSPSRRFQSTPAIDEKVDYELVQPMNIDMPAQIGAFGAGLYLEDKKSHSEYHSPPNRFYEMLSAGLPMIFQPECGATLRRAGYDPQPYAARNTLEVERLFARREEIGREQRERWMPIAREEHRRLTLDAVPLAWNKLTETTR